MLKLLEMGISFFQWRVQDQLDTKNARRDRLEIKRCLETSNP